MAPCCRRCLLHALPIHPCMTPCCRWCLLFNVVAHTWLDCAFAQSTPSYGPWTSWSQCSVSCADGVRFRYRQCPHVKSDPAYRHCPGEPIMFQDCQNPPCSATLQPAQPTGAPADASGGILEVDLDCDFECAPDTPDCSQLEAACRSSIHDPSANSHGNFFGGGAGRRRRRRSIGRRSLVHGGNIGHTYGMDNLALYIHHL